MTAARHALSLDVEDFTSAAVLYVCGRVTPPTPAVVGATERMLGLFGERGVRATCFVLGEVAAAYPALVRRIASEGHELGVHGWHHHRIQQLAPPDYRDAIRRAKGLLEDLAGAPVDGYRAVAMSLTRQTWWAYDVLADLGFSYSSSVYPFRGRRYGVPDAPVGPHRVTTGGGASILEIPLSVVSLGSLRLPALGGGYIRHFPFVVSCLALRWLERQGRRAVVYLHPYEIEADRPLQADPASFTEPEARAMRRFVRGQVRNRDRTEAKVRRLLGEAAFAPLGEVFAAELGRSGAAP